MKKILIEKTSKGIKLTQVLIQLGFILALVLVCVGIYFQSTASMFIGIFAAPFLILAAIFLRWWRWWQHD